MPPRYAENTSVSTDQSLIEVKRTVERYGATGFAHGFDVIDGVRIEAIEFKMRDRRARFILRLPDPNSKEFLYTPVRRTMRTKQQAREAWEQASRQRWRALALTIKAKLESVEAGIETFDESFMAQLVMSNGATVSQWMVPQIATMYREQRMPRFLPMLPAPDDAQ